MARRRRREVLLALGLAALTTVLLARAWSAVWALHLLIDVAFIAYGWAVLAIERPQAIPVRPSLDPVADAGPFEQGRPGPRRDPVDSTIG